MKAYRHEGHWDLANSFLVEIILVHQIFIQHLICSCHFARSTEGNVKKKKKCEKFNLWLPGKYLLKKDANIHILLLQTKQMRLGECGGGGGYVVTEFGGTT